MLHIKSYFPQLLTIILAFFIYSSHAQINGNGKLITKVFDMEDVYKIEANLYGDITLDMAEEAGITIIAEENIMDFIGINVESGTLNFDQKKWIEPSLRIKIIVGAPNLREVVMDTHDDLKVINITGDVFKVDAEIGKVILSGEVDDLRIKAKNGTIEASMLKARLASVRIKGDGRATLNVSEMVDCNIGEDAKLVNINAEGRTNGCNEKSRKDVLEYAATKFINLKIKNNSWSRKHFVVVGPKPNGRNFSYGFPMMPGAVKKERWTVGTKVYRENSLGMRNLLVTLSEENDGQTVKLFD
ncbi:MAG: hypothetical protein ACI86M_001542 [Saprospiraceae bacterium]|jgi:hypothetical protein